MVPSAPRISYAFALCSQSFVKFAKRPHLNWQLKYDLSKVSSQRNTRNVRNAHKTVQNKRRWRSWRNGHQARREGGVEPCRRAKKYKVHQSAPFLKK